MLEFLKDLPFSIEVWKMVAWFLAVAVVVLAGVYKKYFILRDETDKKNDENFQTLIVMIKELRDDLENINGKIEDIEVQYNKISVTIDRFIQVITTTDEIGERQKEQLEILNRIIQNFKTKDICELKEDIHVEDKGEETINLKRLLDMICDEYELHKKD